MKENHVTKESFLKKTNYLNHYSLNLLIGSLFLTLPTFSVMLLIILWENYDFLWLSPLFGILSWFLVIPSTYIIARPSKERISVDILSMGFMAMLLLCVILIPYKQAHLTHPLGLPSPEIESQFSVPFDFKERESEYLEQLHFLRETLKKEEEE